LDPTKGSVFAIEYDSTGFGSATFMLLTTGEHPVHMHRVQFSNNSQSLGLLNPQFPCTATASTTTSATPVTIRIASLAAFTDAPLTRASIERALDASKTVTSTSYIPVLCLQNRSTFNSITNTVSALLRNLTVATTFTGGLNLVETRCVVAFMEAPALTGATWSDVSTSSSVMPFSTTATAVSGGAVLFSAGLKDFAHFDLSSRDIVLSPGTTYCIACKLSSSSSSYSVTASASWGECF
jgi:hypothetical protein